MMQPKVISREIVKPSPSNHPNIHNLSCFDIDLRIYIPLLFFYTSQNPETIAHNHISSVLKTSLSDILSRYYPLAGRPKDDLTIYCNDEGAQFLESKLECSLSEFLKNPDDLEILKPLFPDSLAFQDSSQGSPLAVQVTYFQCGGMSIGICVCHSILDMTGMSNFINEWSSIAKNSDEEIHPEFNIGSFYPPLHLPKQQEKHELSPSDLVYRRVVFEGSMIAKMKEMVADQVQNPTRVEVVSSLLYKSSIFANAKATSSGSLSPSVMAYEVSLHTKLAPPLSERSRGNIHGHVWVLSGRDKREVELGYLVKQFRKAKIEVSNSCVNSKKEDLCMLPLKAKECLNDYSKEREIYAYASWCRFPFYELNFGWGKPLWVTTIPLNKKNFILLKDTREGDGIEAFIYLEKKVMTIFENDQELLSFCCFSPSVLDLDSCA